MSELDELLSEARLAEPDALDAEGEEALVRAARRSAGDGDDLDALVADAARAELAPLDELEVRRVAERAAMMGRARHRRWTRRRVMGVSGVAAALAAAAVTLAIASGPEPSAPPEAEAAAEPRSHGEATDLELATGDHLVAAAGARYHVELPEPERRAVRLDEGTVLFDVRRIEGGRFTVSTPEARVAVLGTVFTVRSADRGTTVRVYEGRVEVQGEGQDAPRVVSRGGVVHLGRGAPLSDPLAEEGEEVARQRTRLAVRETETGWQTATVPADHVDEPPDVEGPRPEGRREGSSPTASGAASDLETATDLRTRIATGDAEGALSLIRGAIARGESDPYLMLEGDALRSLGRVAEAADAYRRAAGVLPAPKRQQAGFLEARLRAGGLGDPSGALRALHQAGVTASGSPLRERALALEAQLHQRLGHGPELRAVATTYLAAYPDGSRAAAMQGYLDAR